jgi:hypothetical protein
MGPYDTRKGERMEGGIKSSQLLSGRNRDGSHTQKIFPGMNNCKCSIIKQAKNYNKLA